MHVSCMVPTSWRHGPVAAGSGDDEDDEEEDEDDRGRWQPGW